MAWTFNLEDFLDLVDKGGEFSFPRDEFVFDCLIFNLRDLVEVSADCDLEDLGVSGGEWERGECFDFELLEVDEGDDEEFDRVDEDEASMLTSWGDLVVWQ